MISHPDLKVPQDDGELAGALLAHVLGDAHGQRQPAVQRVRQGGGSSGGGRGDRCRRSRPLSRGHGSAAEIQVMLDPNSNLV